MPKGKPWTAEEVKQLKKLIEEGAPIETMMGKLGKSKQAVLKKIERLGLSEVVVAKGYTTTTSLLLPKELPSVEDALKILAAALKESVKSGLDKVEVQRLQVVATLARTYKDLLVDYINYRQIEARLIEMEEKYEHLASQAKGNAPQQNNATVAPAPTG
jgi:hypothetical protein